VSGDSQLAPTSQAWDSYFGLGYPRYVLDNIQLDSEEVESRGSATIASSRDVYLRKITETRRLREVRIGREM